MVANIVKDYPVIGGDGFAPEPPDCGLGIDRRRNEILL
jgi:hypothetical protein